MKTFNGQVDSFGRTINFALALDVDGGLLDTGLAGCYGEHLRPGQECYVEFLSGIIRRGVIADVVNHIVTPSAGTGNSPYRVVRIVSRKTWAAMQAAAVAKS